MARAYGLALAVASVAACLGPGAAHATPGAAAAPEPYRSTTLEVRGAKLHVRFAAGGLKLSRQEVLDWISRSADAVTTYYGRFPVTSTQILIQPVRGKGVKGGKAFGGRRTFVRVSVGMASDARDLTEDWVMVHEMIHLALPLLPDRHDWLSEGLAVYVESVARLQAGHLEDRVVWHGFVRGMEHGLPRDGDKGLDFTPTWGRTYWGGAIFCLLADLEIRRRTQGARSLQDALRGVLATGRNFEHHGSIREALAAGDAATGTTSLTELYEAWRATPVDPDLPGLWKRLGVRDMGRRVEFDDSAPLADVRKRIGRRPEA